MRSATLRGSTEHQTTIWCTDEVLVGRAAALNVVREQRNLAALRDHRESDFAWDGTVPLAHSPGRMDSA